MAITLDSTTLPESLIWLDEYAWMPVDQSSEYTLTGALVIEPATKQAGRPITLHGDWATKAEIEALKLKLAADEEMTLTLHDDRGFTVRFDHEGPGISATPVLEYADPTENTQYILTLKFLEV